MSSRRAFLGQVASSIGTLAAAQRNASGANDRIRIGIIGYGDRGSALAREALTFADIQVVAAADVYTRQQERARTEISGIQIFSDYRRMLDDSNVDAVFIATPPHLHASQFVDAAAAGKHIYAESTMAFNVEHAKLMRTAYTSGRGKLTVQIGHQSCSSGQLTDARRFLTTDQMGIITAIHATAHRNTPQGRPQWARPVYPDMTGENIAWTEFLGDAPAIAFDPVRFRNWRYFWDYSGGSVYENMSHQAAFWYKALNLQVPYAVTTAGGLYLWCEGREAPDTMNVSMEQPENLLFTWHSGAGNANLGTTESVLGTNGTIVKGAQLRYWPEKVNSPDREAAAGFTRTAPSAHMRNFIECMRAGKDTNCPFDLGFRVSIACCMAVESYRQRRTVYWDTSSEQIV